MNREIFTGWIKHLDRKMFNEGRTIALIEENCPHIEGLYPVELITAKLKPMEQVIIRALKVKYSSFIVKMYITYIKVKG